MRNENLKKKVGNLIPQPNYVAASKIEKPNATNLQGHEANEMNRWQALISLLNTSKLDAQFYRSENETAKYLQFLITKCGEEDVYLTAKCIVYSRTNKNGLRTINQLAAVLLAPYVSGTEWGARFYSLWDKKEKKGGCVVRADDMKVMYDIYKILNKTTITNAMKKGFRSALESYEPYYLLKYKKDVRDIANLVRPNPNDSSIVSIDAKLISKELSKSKDGSKRCDSLINLLEKQHQGKINIPTLSAIILGLPVSADTWEANNSEAGQVVAKAVKEGKISETEANSMLDEGKAENWKGLLKEGKLGILAALRNLRSIIKVVDDIEVLQMVEDLVSNKDLIAQGRIMPYHIDLANEILCTEFSSPAQRGISMALARGIESATPNLKELGGRNAILLDVSKSMQQRAIVDPNKKFGYKTTCQKKATLLAAMLVKGLNADLIAFGGNAKQIKWDPNRSIFDIASDLQKLDWGATNLHAGWDCLRGLNRQYDRVFILSDYECNRGSSYEGYKSYVEKCGDPWVYSIDLASYGSAALAGDKVRYYFGYGFQLFDDIAADTFDPNFHLNEVNKITI